MLRYHKSIVLIKKENKYFSTDIKFNQNSTFENDLKFLKEFKVQFYQKRNNNILEKFKDFRRIFITNRE
jgi:hypothetical protein